MNGVEEYKKENKQESRGNVKYIMWFIGALLGRHLCDLIYWFLGYGPRLAGATRVSVDSTKSTVVFLVLLATFLLMNKKKLFVGTIIGLGSGLLVIAYGTRGIWVTSTVCLITLLYMLGAKKAMIMTPITIILLAIILTIMQSFRVERLVVVESRSLSRSSFFEASFSM